MTTVSNTPLSILLLRKHKRDEKRDYNKNKKEEIELDNKKIVNDIDSNIKKSNDKLIDIRKKIKLNDYNKPKYNHTEKQILHEIAKYNVLKLKLDNNFIMRNTISTKMCPKILKNKECKYDECTFAHTLTEIRNTKCIAHIYNICEFGNNCKHDHSNSKLPELPVKQPDEVQPKEVTLEDLLLSGLNIEVLSLIGEYLIEEYFPLIKLPMEDLSLSKELSLIEKYLPLTIEERC